jgi:hypothetical protein
MACLARALLHSLAKRRRTFEHGAVKELAMIEHTFDVLFVLAISAPAAAVVLGALLLLVPGRTRRMNNEPRQTQVAA